MADTADVVRAGTRAMAAQMHTSIPAKVTLYDPVTNTLACEAVTNQPFFNVDGTRDWEALPSLVGVPVLWPRFGGRVIRGMLLPGDHVLLVFSETSLAEWRATGQVSNPIDSRRHSVGYPFAIPGAFPDTDPLSPTDAIEVAAGALLIGTDGGDSEQIIIGGLIPGIRLGAGVTTPVAMAPGTLAFMAAVATYIAGVTTAALNAPTNADHTLFAAAIGALGAPVATAATAAITAVPSLNTKAE